MIYTHYKDLKVWQKSMDLVVRIYDLNPTFPSNEQYGLTSQIRRAAVSIPSYIAEGSRRRGKDAKQFLVIAYASGSEVETQLELAKRLKFSSEKQCEQVERVVNEVMRTLNTLVNRD